MMVTNCYINGTEFELINGYWHLNGSYTEINPLLDENVNYILDSPVLTPIIELSVKELEQFKYHLNGRQYNDIADLMNVSLPTVKLRATTIISKFGGMAKTMNELVIIYYKYLIKGTTK